MASYTELPTSDEKNTMVDVPISPPAVAPEPSRARCLVSRCCGCFSLSTGVAILAYFDLFSGVSNLFAVGMVMLARTHEHAIDNELVKLMHNVTADMVERKVDEVNMGINVAAALSPMLVLLACVSVAAGCWGLRAAKGDACSARKFYAWKLASAVWVVASALMGKPMGIVQVALAVYFALVARSFWLQLAAESVVLPTVVTTMAPSTASTTTPAATSNPVVFVGNPVN